MAWRGSKARCLATKWRALACPLLLLLLSLVWQASGSGGRPARASWAVKVKGGSSASEEADGIARAAGMKNAGRLDPFMDVFVFVEGAGAEGRGLARRSVLVGHPGVAWMSEQRPLRRTKRGLLSEVGMAAGLRRGKAWLCVFVYASVRVFACMCLRVLVCVCVCARVCACACKCVRAYMCVWAMVCHFSLMRKWRMLPDLPMCMAERGLAS